MKQPGCVQCLQCGEILLSQSRHDFEECSCPNQSFVDGGYDYFRAGGMNLRKVARLKLEKLSGKKKNIRQR